MQVLATEICEEKRSAQRAGARREGRTRRRPCDDGAARHDRIAEALVAGLAGHDRPAIVRTGLDAIHFVLTARGKEPARSMLGLVQHARVRMEREALPVAMAERVHRRSGERVVRRHRAVLLEPEDLAAKGAAILRSVLLLAIARRDVQLAVRSERDAATIVIR